MSDFKVNEMDWHNLTDKVEQLESKLKAVGRSEYKRGYTKGIEYVLKNELKKQGL